MLYRCQDHPGGDRMVYGQFLMDGKVFGKIPCARETTYPS
jgi:hypothetical protein